MSSLLLSERPLVVLPSLVKRVGLTRAVILQQIHWLLQQPRSGRMIDGRKWVWGDYDKWRELYFPFWSRRTLQRHILRLEEEGFLISAQHNLLNWDRTKYYRLDYDRLHAALPYAGLGTADGAFDAPLDAPLDDAPALGGALGGEPDGCGTAAGAAGAAGSAEAGTDARPKPGHRNSRAGAGLGEKSSDAASPSAPVPAAQEANGGLPMGGPETAASSPQTGSSPGTLRGSLRETAPGTGSSPAVAADRGPGAAVGASPAGAAAGNVTTPSFTQQRPRLRRTEREPEPRTAQEGADLLHAVIFGGKGSGDELPPPIRAFWELHGRLPNKAQRRMIEDAKITDQVLWRRCLYTWAARGYNPMRIDGPLEWYANPDLMDLRREQRPAAPPPAPAGPMVLDVSPEIAALLAGKV